MNAPTALAEPHVARFTIDEFVAIEKSGVFERYAKTELINGEIIVLNAQASEHFTAKTRIFRRLADAVDQLGRGLEAWSEGTVEIRPDNLPEPDLFVTRVTPVTGFVPAADVVLVAEIAFTSLQRDMGEKAMLYASGGIGEYWIVDVNARTIHRMWSPDRGSYREHDEVAFGEPLSAMTIAGLTVSTAEL